MLLFSAGFLHSFILCKIFPVLKLLELKIWHLFNKNRLGSGVFNCQSCWFLTPGFLSNPAAAATLGPFGANQVAAREPTSFPWLTLLKFYHSSQLLLPLLMLVNIPPHTPVCSPSERWIAPLLSRKSTSATLSQERESEREREKKKKPACPPGLPHSCIKVDWFHRHICLFY